MKIINVKHDAMERYPRKYGIVIPIKLADDGTILAVTNPTSCRESAISFYSNFASCKDDLIIKTRLQELETVESYKANREKIFKQSRVIFYGLNKYEFNRVNKGLVLKALHAVEEKIGLPKTEVFEVKDNNDNVRKVLFVGSNKWFRSSHTASLWLLLIRLALRTTIFKANNWQDLYTLVTTKFPKTEIGNTNSTDKDKFYARKTIDCWLVLMQNLNKIFPPHVRYVNRFDCGAVHVVPKGTYAHAIGSEGILTMVIGRSHHKNAPIFTKLVASAKRRKITDDKLSKEQIK